MRVKLAPKVEANVEQAVPFFGVRDIQESLRFYVDGLGFSMTRDWIDDGRLRWCWLEVGGAAIMLQEFSQDGHHSSVPTGDLGIGVTVYFICKDALAIYRELRSRGVAAKRPFVGNAMWVTEVADPDGYVLFFESPTDAAEETIYATPLGWCCHGSRFGNRSHDHAGVAKLLLAAGAVLASDSTEASPSVEAVLADWRP